MGGLFGGNTQNSCDDGPNSRGIDHLGIPIAKHNLWKYSQTITPLIADGVSWGGVNFPPIVAPLKTVS